MTVQEAKVVVLENVKVQIGDNLALNKMKIKDLAEQIGASENAISLWKMGHIVPSLQSALALSRALGVTLDRLVTGED